MMHLEAVDPLRFWSKLQDPFPYRNDRHKNVQNSWGFTHPLLVIQGPTPALQCRQSPGHQPGLLPTVSSGQIVVKSAQVHAVLI